jgi:predicted PurR-regulated permease PerM
LRNQPLRVKHLEWLPVLLLTIVAFKLVENYLSLWQFVKIVIGLLLPFVWGFGIAYILNPLMKSFETYLKLPRLLSLTFTYMILIFMIYLAVTGIIPSIASSIRDIIDNGPTYFASLQSFLLQASERIESFDAINLEQLFDKWSLENMMAAASANLNKALSAMFFGVLGFAASILKFVVGLALSIYLLKDKEKFMAGIKRSTYAHFEKGTADGLCDLVRESDSLFTKFIIGKMVDSLIIGIMAYIGFILLGIRYPILLALIVGITNMIPYFGPFIGAVPAVLITLFYSPVQALWVLIFITALQQFDGYVLGPKILGDSVGVKPFLIILAILLGGGLFGLLGMFLAVPTVAVIRNYYKRYVERRLAEKGIVDL